MFLPIRDGIRDALQTYFEYHLRARMVSKIKEVGSPKSKEVVDEGSQTLPQPATSTPDPRKGQGSRPRIRRTQNLNNLKRRGRKLQIGGVGGGFVWEEPPEEET